MPEPQPVPVNPRGPKYCTCVQPWAPFSNAYPREVEPRFHTEGGFFVCDSQMTGEDGYCDSCRGSSLCAGWRKNLSIPYFKEISV